MGLEPTTPALRKPCSTVELHRRKRLSDKHLCQSRVARKDDLFNRHHNQDRRHRKAGTQVPLYSTSHRPILQEDLREDVLLRERRAAGASTMPSAIVLAAYRSGQVGCLGDGGLTLKALRDLHLDRQNKQLAAGEIIPRHRPFCIPIPLPASAIWILNRSEYRRS